MGREAVCSGTWRRRRFEGIAHLETESVVVRGGAVRVEMPFAAMTRVDSAHGRLTLDSADGTLVLELGDQADRWAGKIRHPPSLADKLGLTADSVVAIVGVEDEGVIETVRARAKSVTTGHLARGASLILAGLGRAADLQRFASLRDAIAPDGAIWTIRPKGVPEISESAVRAAALAVGLVDVKVARVSATHTAEKFVIPKAARARRGNGRTGV
jgi:hypothetical protein